MLIDDIKIEVAAGHGGKGCVAFNKNLMSLGPAGGSGGKGGSVIFVGVSDLNALGQFRFRKQVNAQNGHEGKGQFCDGPDAKDEMIKIPVGTVIHNLTTGADEEITKVGQEILIAKGGRGGRGNFQFRGSKNTTPKEFEQGKPGQEFELRLELKMIADIGFVGLPNLGKSSLLNELTNANVKVANYQFTTLEPNLGVYYSLILADIPGLIEGASDGKGLGIKFLKHVERTKIIFHFLAADSEDINADYKTIRKELESFNPALLEKPEYILVSRSDLVSEKDLKKILTKAKRINKNAIPISIHNWDQLQKVKELLNVMDKEK
ncbi:MAG: GTPase ObgE [bacterium]